MNREQKRKAAKDAPETARADSLPFPTGQPEEGKEQRFAVKRAVAIIIKKREDTLEVLKYIADGFKEEAQIPTSDGRVVIVSGLVPYTPPKDDENQIETASDTQDAVKKAKKGAK